MESLLEAAAQVLESEGFERMTTTKIALRAGASVGSLYQYYPSKDAVLLALFERKIEGVLARLTESAAASRGQPLAARVQSIVEALFREKARRAKLGAELSRQAPRLDKKRIALRLVEEVHRIVDGILEEHEDEIEVKDRGMASWLAVHAVNGIADAAMLGPLERLRDPEFIAAVTAHVLGALGARRATSSMRLTSSRGRRTRSETASSSRASR